MTPDSVPFLYIPQLRSVITNKIKKVFLRIWPANDCLISSPGQKGIAKKEKGVLLGGTKCGRLFINKGEKGESGDWT